MSGYGVDIGYRGEVKDASPVIENAIGVDKDFPGYDGIHLPYKYGALDFVFSSHCFEHLNWTERVLILREWMRVIKVGGHIVMTVPHMYLYEKKSDLPSKWNEDHKIFFTPGKLLTEIENALDPNSYRVVHLRDNDDDFDYSRGPDVHSGGCYEIELVLKKINQPNWSIV